MISLMIVDDHPMVREGLAAMLESERDFAVSALAATGEEAVAIGRVARPDVVVTDVRMPGIDGFGVLARMRETRPDARVLLMAGMPLKEEEARARAEGARGDLPKNLDQDRLVSARRAIARDEPGFVCEEFQSAPSTLTARELDVLREVASGKQREAIASALGIGPESVKTHLKGIMSKLGCPNATSAVSRAYELGILRA
ncbi:MAG: response regulator transcription factor [Kiritimatiellae bacterium]|nr:response regulator transcription factor [Kiritimatiellia bacterium]